jgi:hypothetical protein
MGTDQTFAELFNSPGTGGQAIDLLAKISDPQVQATAYKIDASGY